MCLSSAYCVKNREEKGELVQEYVSGISINGDEITLTDVLGFETVVKGTLLSVDMIKNELRILTA